MVVYPVIPPLWHRQRQGQHRGVELPSRDRDPTAGDRRQRGHGADYRVVCLLRLLCLSGCLSVCICGEGTVGPTFARYLASVTLRFGVRDQAIAGLSDQDATRGD